MIKKFDVIIIGAGPSGCAAALALSKSGLKVALLDKEKYPRNKTCGDAVPGPALSALDKILPEAKKIFESLIAKQYINKADVYTAKNRLIPISWKTKAYNCKREDFDNFLLDLVKNKTNTHVFESHKVTDIQQTNVVLVESDNKFKAEAEVVIACDGANSFVSRSFGLFEIDKNDNCMAVRAYFSNVDCLATTNEMFLLDDIPGYFWIFPVGDDLFNVGLGLTHTALGRTINLKERFNDIIKNHSFISNKFKLAKQFSKVLGHRLPLWRGEKKVSGERFLLCGDAANLIDPLGGHGIDKAIKSGALAAKHIISSFEENDFSEAFMKNYDLNLNKTIGRELNFNLKIMRFLSRYPSVLEVLARLAGNKKLNSMFHKFFYKSNRTKK